MVDRRDRGHARAHAGRPREASGSSRTRATTSSACPRRSTPAGISSSSPTRPAHRRPSCRSPTWPATWRSPRPARRSGRTTSPRAARSEGRRPRSASRRSGRPIADGLTLGKTPAALLPDANQDCTQPCDAVVAVQAPDGRAVFLPASSDHDKLESFGDPYSGSEGDRSYWALLALGPIPLSPHGHDERVGCRPRP